MTPTSHELANAVVRLIVALVVLSVTVYVEFHLLKTAIRDFKEGFTYCRWVFTQWRKERKCKRCA